MALTRNQSAAGIVTAAAACAVLPRLGLPDYALSLMYLVFFWVALSTSWGLLSGYAGYWSFGHAAFYGVGVYATGTLTTRLHVPFLLTIPIAAALAALLALGIGLVAFRNPRLRGKFFALLTLSMTFVIATIVSNTPLDNGAGVNLADIRLSDIAGSVPATLYTLGLGLAFGAMLISFLVRHSALGMGLAAIHDDEAAAEVKGVPTLRYKLAAFMLSSAIAGAVGAVHAV